MMLILALSVSCASQAGMRCIQLQEKTDSNNASMSSGRKKVIYQYKKSIERDKNANILWDYYGGDLKHHYRVKFKKSAKGKKPAVFPVAGAQYDCA